MPHPRTLRRISRPPPDLKGWMACFDPRELPVLDETVFAIDALRSNQDAVDARMLSEIVSADPLLTLKLLAHVGRLRQAREGDGGRGDAETVTAALLMLGVGPFFQVFAELQAAEPALADVPGALQGFKSVLKRSHRAANFAVAFAAHRLDHDAPVIHEAALLHDFGELVLWLHAPDLALKIVHAQSASPQRRTAAVQRELLNIELTHLQHALMVAWRLPELLVQITDDRHPDAAQVSNVLLAIRLARHSADGWDNAAIPDDVAAIAELLHLGSEPTMRLLRSIDAT